MDTVFPYNFLITKLLMNIIERLFFFCTKTFSVRDTGKNKQTGIFLVKGDHSKFIIWLKTQVCLLCQSTTYVKLLGKIIPKKTPKTHKLIIDKQPEVSVRSDRVNLIHNLYFVVSLSVLGCRCTYSDHAIFK